MHADKRKKVRYYHLSPKTFSVCMYVCMYPAHRRKHNKKKKKEREGEREKRSKKDPSGLVTKLWKTMIAYHEGIQR